MLGGALGLVLVRDLGCRVRSVPNAHWKIVLGFTEKVFRVYVGFRFFKTGHTNYKVFQSKNM